MARSIARQAAMQLLYEQLTGGEGDDESLALIYEQLGKEGAGAPPLKEKDKEYIASVLQGVWEHRQELDDIIQRHSSGEWALSRVANVDLSILRLCVYELLYRDDIPDNVAISEAMELAGRYSEPKSSRYINGVLGAIGRGEQEG